MDLVEVHFAAAGRSVFVSPGTTLLAAAALAEVEIVTGCTRGMWDTPWSVICSTRAGDAAGKIGNGVGT